MTFALMDFCLLSRDLQMLSKKIWDRFLLSIDVFGEKTMLTEGKRIKVLYGSVESHYKIFERAYNEVMNDINASNDKS